MTKRFKLYDEETLDTYIEDNEDCYSDGTPKSYWFGENEDFCNLFYKLNELSEENKQLKQTISDWKGSYDELYQDIKILEKENEQLKSCNGEMEDYLARLEEENKQLKQALLFFLDVANSQCSLSFQKDMEHDCQKLFNCSYSEAKEKYSGYDATWWELGE